MKKEREEILSLNSSTTQDSKDFLRELVHFTGSDK